MASAIQSYAGVSTPAFLRIEKVQFSVLPQSEIKQLSIPMKSGSYFVNKKHGVRTFSVDFTLKSDSINDVMYRADDLATWLNYNEPQELIFRDKPDITYMAIVDDSVDITKFSNTGKGQIRFLCVDPYGLGAEREYAFAPTDTEPVMVVNGGNIDTAPIIEMEFSQSVTDFSIQTDDDVLYFGDPFDETTQVVKNLKPNVIHDLMATTSGWSGGLYIDGGTIAGSIVTNGTDFMQANNDYGTGGAWHGGALVKSIGREIQDFTVEAIISLRNIAKHTLGRVEIYLLDVNNNSIGKIALKDIITSGNYSMWEARAGTLATGTYFAKTYPIRYKHGWQDFYGKLRITRKGNKWTAYIGKYNESLKIYQWQWTKNWTDTKNSWLGELASVQVHFGQYKTHSAPEMRIMQLDVWEHLTPEENERGYVFEAGDVLRIDNVTGDIRKNGETFLDELYPSSSFLKLQKGVNGISVSEPVVINGTLSFRERWL